MAFAHFRKNHKKFMVLIQELRNSGIKNKVPIHPQSLNPDICIHIPVRHSSKNIYM
ncbi:hypothetical protein SBDP1_480018 [Syntrophobacter sp. SbD1]|nr:hypothetical protein SBDP1_480018 [Syntrophobacter sp. SbD1]